MALIKKRSLSPSRYFISSVLINFPFTNFIHPSSETITLTSSSSINSGTSKFSIIPFSSIVVLRLKKVVFEPNLSLAKSSFIPIIICDRAKHLINKVIIGNTKHLAEKSSCFVKFANISSLVKESRIVFAPRINRTDHLLRLQLSNVTLDTMIYNGHTTTTDSLQSAVPVVTLIGNHFASRVSASLLSSIGLEELITKNISEYQSLVIRLVSDSVYYNQIKNNLIDDDSNNDFYNIEKFVIELEESLISIIS